MTTTTTNIAWNEFCTVFPETGAVHWDGFVTQNGNEIMVTRVFNKHYIRNGNCVWSDAIIVHNLDKSYFLELSEEGIDSRTEAIYAVLDIAAPLLAEFTNREFKKSTREETWDATRKSRGDMHLWAECPIDRPRPVSVIAADIGNLPIERRAP